MKKKFIIVSIKNRIDKKRKEINFSGDQRLVHWIHKINLIPFFISDNSQISILKRLNFSGLIISGGSDIKKDKDRVKLDLKLLNWAKKNKKPVLGICYGLQLLAFENGAKLVKLKGHVTKLKGHKILTIFNNSKFPKKVNSFHNYGFYNKPKNYNIIARSTDGSIEAIKHSILKIEGWMWHPERDKIFNKVLIEGRYIFS